MGVTPTNLAPSAVTVWPRTYLANLVRPWGDLAPSARQCDSGPRQTPIIHGNAPGGGIIVYFWVLARPSIAVAVDCRAGGCKVSMGWYMFLARNVQGHTVTAGGARLAEEYNVNGGRGSNEPTNEQTNERTDKHTNKKTKQTNKQTTNQQTNNEQVFRTQRGFLEPVHPRHRPLGRGLPLTLHPLQ